jgi:hypothetical protein
MLVHFVDRLTPPWAKGGSVGHWLNLFRLVALAVDMMIEGVWQGRKAGLPNAIDVPGVPGYGGYESVKALTKYLAPDAGVYQGLTELPPALAQRVRHAQDGVSGWPAAGLITGLMEQLAGVLGPTPPLMRIVNRNGDWWTRNQDGSYDLVRMSGAGIHYDPTGVASANGTVGAAWPWDTSTVPPAPGQGLAGEWWLIVYEPLNTPYGTSGPYTFNSGAVLGHVWNDLQSYPAISPNPWAATWGTNSPACLVSLIFAVIAARSTVGLHCNHVIVCTDASQFAPDGSSTLPAGALGSAYPDGTWGWDTATAQDGTMTITRNSTAIYWRFPRIQGT